MNSPTIFDWRIQLDMDIRDFVNGAEKIAEALNAGGEQAAYIRANARQFGEPLPLQLVCSVWLSMEGLGTSSVEANRTSLQYSGASQVQSEAAE